MLDKPIINFTTYKDGEPIVGNKTVIAGVSNHPNQELNSGSGQVLTSTVQKIVSPDEFETMNTIYKRI